MRLTAIQTVVQAAVPAVALVAAALLLVLTQVRALRHIRIKPLYHIDRK